MVGNLTFLLSEQQASACFSALALAIEAG